MGGSRLRELMYQNVSSLEYGNSRVLPNAPMSMQCFNDVQVNFEKKFPFLVLAGNTIMLQHLIIQY